MRVRAVAWGVIGGGLVAALVAGCAAGPDEPRSSELSERAPAGPLFQRTITTPAGRSWDFRIGGGYEPSDR